MLGMLNGKTPEGDTEHEVGQQDRSRDLVSFGCISP